MCKCNYCFVDAIISLVLGIVIGLIYSTGIITNIETILCIVLGLSILTILLSLLNRKCLCKNGKCIAISGIGAIVCSIIALSITLATSLIYAIIIGIFGFFATFVILSLYRLIICITQVSCECNN